MASKASRKPVEKARAAEEPPLKKPRTVAAKAAAELIVKDEVAAKAAAKLIVKSLGEELKVLGSGFLVFNSGI
jgi:hypothetical protein